ncbi:hypothetical protein EBI00_06485 [Marinomonas hwangdonensis]|uniref:Uncharacterized protein n=1 Tax=Marinomonas hwangdonensis TaxID=1053647 RepID=A0A3M8Q906_9GAMM|nr:hypothetical protein [Marinomonas hwangdonensis]RNF51540.1 hypothetical protein EBI00_06485 [Marinomonas hwangdonensis]
MNIESHPISIVIDSIHENIELEFSIYKYQPQSIIDERKSFPVKKLDLSDSWLLDQLNRLNENEELAFHSKFKIGSRYYHMPMIDFNCKIEDIDKAKKVLSNLLPKEIFHSLSFYESGRSLHAYGSTPIPNTRWVEFMGRLLLANLPNEPSIIDTRWVGHRLVGGYSSLRWSANSDYYLKIPTKI